MNESPSARMHKSYSSHPVCLSIYLSVCPVTILFWRLGTENWIVDFKYYHFYIMDD